MRTALVLATTSLAVLLASAALPASGPIAAPLDLKLDAAHAQATKSRGQGGSGSGANVRGAGDRLGDLLAGWGVPIVTAVAGFLLIAALVSRNIGATLGIVVSAIVVLIFLLTPESIQSAAEGISNLIF